MSKVSFPLSLMSGHNVSSLKALRAREIGRQQAGAPLAAAEKLVSQIDSWMDHVATYDGGQDDFAAHKDGLVVLNNKVQDNVAGGKQNLSAELRNDAQGRPAAAHIEVTPFHWRGDDLNTTSLNVLDYKRTGTREIYSEQFVGQKVTLVIDHAKGTLTFDHPQLEKLTV